MASTAGKSQTKLVDNEGGYDYHFVTSLSDGSDVVCKICHLPSRNPHLSSCCGHTFCQCCTEIFKQIAIHGTVNNACPVCRDSEFPVVQNKQMDRVVRSLHIYCTNEKEGCQWQGEINDIVGHLKSCQYKNVKCENNGCGISVHRQFLKNHMNSECLYRDVGCVHCSLIGSYMFIEGKHKDECPKVPLPCPNSCEVGTVLRQDLDEHKKICPLEMIRCEYYDMGCEMEIARKDVQDHNTENVNKHLGVLKCELANTKKELTQAQKDVATTQKRMVDMQRKFRKQIDNTEHQNQESIKRLEMQLYDSICQLHKNCNPWALKLNAMASMSTTEEQVVPVVLKMTNFAKLKKEKEWWYSDPFYTHNKEYKMRLLVCAAGDTGGKTPFVSVWLSLLNGPSSDKKELLLKGKIKLYNQISNTEHHCVTVECRNNDDASIAEENSWANQREWRDPCFIPHDDLNSRNFLKNDCLFFRVFVKIHTSGSEQPDLLLSHEMGACTKDNMDSSMQEQRPNLLNEYNTLDHVESLVQEESQQHVGVVDDAEPQQKPHPCKEDVCTTDDTQVGSRRSYVIEHIATIFLALCW